MSLAGIRDAIKTQLALISGLDAYDVVPDAVNVPCAFVLPVSGEYHRDFADDVDHRFEIILLLARWADAGEAQDNIDAYLAPTGGSSIKAQVEAADLGSHASEITVEGYRDYGPIEHGGISYLGVKFPVSVLA